MKENKKPVLEKEVMEVSEVRLSHISIKTDGVISRLVIDGVDMSHALSVKYTHEGGDIPKLAVVLPVEEAEVEGITFLEKNFGHTNKSGTAERSIGDLHFGR